MCCDSHWKRRVGGFSGYWLQLFLGIRCKVYMVPSSYKEKVFGRYPMEILGAEVVHSPSDRTSADRKILAQNPALSGSLSIALSEAFDEAHGRDNTTFSWSTVMNHVLLHQTIIVPKAREQMRNAGGYPDIIICAVGGGGAFGGLVFPFYPNRKSDTRITAVETAISPSLSRGRYAYD
jgi:tryptophan synthase beta chain